MNGFGEPDPLLDEFRAAKAEFERLERELHDAAEPSEDVQIALQRLRVARRALWKREADQRLEMAAKIAKNKPGPVRSRLRRPSRLVDMDDEQYKRALQEEIVEDRERAVQLITRKNQLSVYVENSDSPDPAAVEELQHLTAAVSIWRELLKQREMEIRSMTARLLRVRSAKLIQEGGMPREGREILDELDRAVRRGNEAAVLDWCQMIVQRLDQG